MAEEKKRASASISKTMSECWLAATTSTTSSVAVADVLQHLRRFRFL